MRVLVFTQYYPPDFGGNAMLMNQLSQDLVGMGHRVEVITSFPHYPSGVVPVRYRRRLMRVENSNGVKVMRTWLYASPRKTFWRRLLTYASSAASAMAAGLLGRRPDVAVVYTPPLPLAAAAALLSRVKRIPLVVSVQDIFPDVAVNLGVLSEKSLLVKAARIIEKMVYRQATGISVIGESFRQNLERKGVATDKIEMIPNWIDTKFIKPKAKENSFSRRYGLTGKFIVQYAGNHGLTSGVEAVLTCAELARSYEDILFLFIGEGVLKENLQKRALHNGLKNVMFLPFQPYEDLPFVLASADVCLVTLTAKAHATSVPGKLYTIMAASRPSIAAVDSLSDTAKQIRSAKCGLVVAPESPQAMLNAILELKSDKEEAREMGRRGLTCVRKDYSRQSGTQRYESLLRDAVRIGCL
jgi:colanic acid biosynthesis glycosyl transferase WcaI